MVLFSFSIPEHIPLILSGQKVQTTRIPRKPKKNGKAPYSVGERVQLYYRSRQTPNCKNCIDLECLKQWEKSNPIKCMRHSNFFGESVITEIVHYRQGGEYEENGNETWVDFALAEADQSISNAWAKADGFESWEDAHKWFTESTGDIEWAYKDLDVIKWDGTKIARRVT